MLKILGSIILVIMFVGCNQAPPASADGKSETAPVAESTPAPPAEEPEVTEPAPSEAEAVVVELDEANLAEIEAILAAADPMDGTEDKVVHKCAGCNLGMDGKADYPVEVAGYELHHCSDQCRQRFVAKAEPNLLALKSKVTIH